MSKQDEEPIYHSKEEGKTTVLSKRTYTQSMIRDGDEFKRILNPNITILKSEESKYHLR